MDRKSVIFGTLDRIYHLLHQLLDLWVKIGPTYDTKSVHGNRADQECLSMVCPRRVSRQQHRIGCVRFCRESPTSLWTEQLLSYHILHLGHQLPTFVRNLVMSDALWLSIIELGRNFPKRSWQPRSTGIVRQYKYRHHGLETALLYTTEKWASGFAWVADLWQSPFTLWQHISLAPQQCQWVLFSSIQESPLTEWYPVVAMDYIIPSKLWLARESRRSTACAHSKPTPRDLPQ